MAVLARHRELRAFPGALPHGFNGNDVLKGALWIFGGKCFPGGAQFYCGVARASAMPAPAVGHFPDVAARAAQVESVFMLVRPFCHPMSAQPSDPATVPGLARRLLPNRGLPTIGWLLFIALLLSFSHSIFGSENVPHRPFAYWAELPEQGQLVAGFVYAESEAYHMWAGGQYHNVTAHADGESYGTDINQGYLALQYGLTERWALDLSVGYVATGWRFFDHSQVSSTSGLMDIGLGARYQLFNETNAPSCWVPTLTFRAGAVLPGSYDQHFIFAPGLRSAAIEPELLLRKHVGWTGFGVYGDVLYRWNRTTGNDQYIIATGIFQQLKGWEVDLGYKHLQTLSGSDILYPVDPASNGGYNINYPRDPRENYDALEFGFSYTTSERHWRYGFQLTSVLDGNNSDAKLWVGGSLDIPFSIFRKP